MRPANDPTVDYADLVRTGYDRCAATYAESREAEAQSELSLLAEHLDDGASILDIGCGAGVPVARELAKRFAVTGVDISGEMVRLARTNVPDGRFVHADITSAEFAASSFDAVVAFYSIFHLPREAHRSLFRRIHEWMRPGGYLMCTLSRCREAAYTEDDFFGETMYWSNFGLADYADILTVTGFSLLKTSVVGHGYSGLQTPLESHPLVFARKPIAFATPSVTSDLHVQSSLRPPA